MKKDIYIRYIPQVESLSDEDILKALAALPEEKVGCVNWAEYPYAPEVSLKPAFSDTHLALLYTVNEEHILGTVMEFNGPVWEDSCVETFIKDPVGEGYYNIEVNCIGTPLAAHRLSRTDFEHFDAERMSRIRCFSSLGHEATDRKDGEWTVCELIPFGLLGLDKAPESLEMNFYKCGDNCRRPHYLSWSPIGLETPNFHCPEFFGKIRLTK